MAVITAAEFKAMMNITTTERDAQIAALIPCVEDDINAITGHSYDGTTGYEWPDWSKLAAARMVSYLINCIDSEGLSSETASKTTYQKEVAGTPYPSSIMSMLDRNSIASIGFGTVASPQGIGHYRDLRMMPGMAGISSEVNPYARKPE